jgi:hypothetical protein
MTEAAKTPNWGPDESRMLQCLEAETPIQDVKIDAIEEEDKDPPIEDTPPNRWRSRKCIVLASLFFVSFITAAATLLTVFLSKKRSSPSFSATVKQFGENHIPPYSWEAAQRDSSSPQAKALHFIGATLDAADPVDRLQQQYALAVLYYSAVASSDSAGILEQENECDWFSYADRDFVLQSTWDGNRSICDDRNRYLLLTLAGSTVDGTIPRELDMLTKLQYINLRDSAVRGTVPTEL